MCVCVGLFVCVFVCVCAFVCVCVLGGMGMGIHPCAELLPQALQGFPPYFGVVSDREANVLHRRQHLADHSHKHVMRQAVIGSTNVHLTSRTQAHTHTRTHTKTHTNSLT